MSVLGKHLNLNTGEPLHSGHTVEDVVSSILDAMWAMGLESSDEESAKKSPGDKSGEDKPDNKDDKAKPSSGHSKDVCPSDWVFKGFMSFMFFAPFEENFEANGFSLFSTPMTLHLRKRRKTHNALQGRKQPPGKQP